MNAYRTWAITLSEEGIFLRGIPVPLLSRRTLQWEDVYTADCVPCSVFHRAHGFGPDISGAWWGPDSGRLFRKHALKLVLRDGVFRFNTLMLTGPEIEHATRVARHFLKQKGPTV